MSPSWPRSKVKHRRVLLHSEVLIVDDSDVIPILQGTVVIERSKAGEIRPDRCLADPPVEVDDIGMIFLDEFGAPSKPVIGPRRRNIGEIIADGSAPVDDPHLCRAIEGGILRVVDIRWDLAAHAQEEIVFHRCDDTPKCRPCARTALARSPMTSRCGPIFAAVQSLSPLSYMAKPS